MPGLARQLVSALHASAQDSECLKLNFMNLSLLDQSPYRNHAITGLNQPRMIVLTLGLAQNMLFE